MGILRFKCWRTLNSLWQIFSIFIWGFWWFIEKKGYIDCREFHRWIYMKNNVYKLGVNTEYPAYDCMRSF
jgi:hypothetical protein